MRLTKRQQTVLVTMRELARPVSRDMLMDAIGAYVSGRSMDGLETEQLIVAHENTSPKLWTLTPAGEQLAKERTQ